jgi:glycosyltransferase involved in cell wall biosynthesis
VRVLVDARNWASGIGRVIENTVPRVAILRPQHSFSVLVRPEHLDRAGKALGPVGNATIVPCDIPTFSGREQTSLTAFARNHDLTWFTNYWVPLFWSHRFIVTVHDLLHLDTELFPVARVKRELSRLVFAKLGREASAIMFDSRFSQREFEARFAKPAISRTIHLGADHVAVLPPCQFNVARKTKRLVVVAATKKHKNFHTVVQAWNQARVADHWSLTIISPAEALRSSIDLAAVTRGAVATQVLSGVTDAELNDVYDKASILLMPSLYEGFGLPLLEGMQTGALCISSTAESLVEIAEGAFVQFVNGRDVLGWTGAIERACALLDRDHRALEPLLRHNMEQARRFRWDDTAEQVATVVDQVLQS